MDFNEKRILGKTGLKVGRLGIAASFGAPANAIEEAFEKGCNYFYWGSFRRNNMRQAIKNINRNGKRDDLVVVIQSYSRSAFLMELFYKNALKSLGIDHADVLLLGCYKNRPDQKLLDKAMQMKEKGYYRYLALSSHNRLLFPRLAKENIFDIFHVRYNAVHRGAENETFPYIQGENKQGIISYTATSWTQLLDKKKMPEGEAPLQASDCYRFVLSNPAVDVCMCGPKDLNETRQALKVIELGPLNSNEIERIKKIGDYIHHPDKQ